MRSPARHRAVAPQRGRVIVLEGLKGSTQEAPRFSTGIGELDRVTGGGIVPGSALLIGGEPGIGKSTLLLQLAAMLARAGRRAVYFSGEEAAAQVRLRAERLGLADAPVALACETNLAHILATLEAGPPPDLIVIDSIQTLWAEAIEAAPGTVSQVRAAAQALIRHAKAVRQRAAARRSRHQGRPDRRPQGDRAHGRHRVVFRRRPRPHLSHPARRQEPLRRHRRDRRLRDGAGGLREVANPSELFLGDRAASSPGAAVFAGLEGTRPLLVEIQALVAPSSLGTPRRAVVGWDCSRLSMLLAVLEARAGFSFAGQDVYLNVAGGLRINEPAADLAAAAALISSLSGVAIPRHRVHFGEVSLSGAINATPLMGPRLKRRRNWGFAKPSSPLRASSIWPASSCGRGVSAHLRELAEEPAPCD